MLVLGAAAVIELLSRGSFRFPNPPAVLLLTVVFSAFIGGVRSGLIAALIAWLYFAYFFSIPGHPLHYTAENLRRVLVWAVATPAMSVMVGILKQRSERAFETSSENAALVAQMAERMRTEQALRQSEARNAAILKGALDCIITMDHTGRILEFNPAAEATFGVRRADVLGHELAELIIPSGLRARHRHGLAHYLATGESPILNQRIEITASRPSGEEFPVELSVIRDPSSDPPIFTGFLRDITERKRAEEALRLSERRFRALLENGSDAIALTKPDGTVVYASPATKRILGYSPEELVGQESFALLHPDDREHIAELYATLLQEPGRSVVTECRVRHKDGSWRWIEGVGANLLADLSVQAIVANYRDVTERKQADESLQRFAAIVEASGDAIIGKTLEGTVLTWNSGAERIYGYAAEEIVGRSVALLIPPDRPREIPDILDRLKRGECVEHFETVRVRKDGTRIDVSLTISPIKDAAGSIVGASTIARDITERKQAEREIHALNKELEDRVRQRTSELQAANRELEAFAYTVAHDLRSPLITLGGFSQMLVEDHTAALPEEAQRLILQIASSARHMSSLIDALLSFSRLGRQPLTQQPVAPADVARQALAELDGVRAERDAAIKIGDLPRCQADPILLKQVFVNLLSNAMKFSRNRQGATVEVGWRRELDDPTHHTYFVADNGVGFDSRYADKLFHVFKRLHRAEDYEGTGVGLAIVHRIIQRHGGRVWAEGQPEKGATFFFTLPKSGAT
jgi:PAS domain S-box-containing protein